MKKTKIIQFLLVFCCLLQFCYSQNYTDFRIKEQYDANSDNIMKTVLPDIIEYTVTNYGAPSGQLAENIGELSDDYLFSLLALYKTTKDKGYLIHFINWTIKIQKYRNDVTQSGAHPGWIIPGEPGLYMDAKTIRPMAAFVYLINHDLNLKNTSLPIQLIDSYFGNFSNYGNFANWLGLRVKETLDWYVDQGYWDDNIGFKDGPSNNAKALGINQHANFAVALIYLGLSDAPNISSNDLFNFRGSASIIGNLYMSQVELFDDGQDCDDRLGYNPDECFALPVMNHLTSHNSYWWFSPGWNAEKHFHLGCLFNIPDRAKCSDHTNGIEDISHAIPVLAFPLATYPIYSGLFNSDDMIRWRNMFTRRIWEPAYNGDPAIQGFHGNVLGTEENINLDPPDNDQDGDGDIDDEDKRIRNCTPGYMGWFNCWKYRSLAFMPLYKYDDAAGDFPTVYDIVMQFYDREIKDDPDIGLQFEGIDYLGLSEVVSAQWDKECVSLTLYNRDVVYDQDFFAKGDLTIAPKESDAFYTAGVDVPYAEPKIFTDGSSTDRFVIEPGVKANLTAGGRVVIKKGFRAKAGSSIRVYIDPTIDCGPGKWGGSSNSQANSDNPITLPEEQTIEEDTALVKDSTQTIKKEIIISLHPNPSTGKFNLSIDDTKDAQVLVVVVDMLGIERYSKVFVLKDDNYTLAIDPEGKLPAGVYMVIAASDNEIYRKKIVIQ